MRALKRIHIWRSRKMYSNWDIVTGLYRGILRREPDPSGLVTHVKRLDGGERIDAVVRSFLESDEYKQLSR